MSRTTHARLSRFSWEEQCSLTKFSHRPGSNNFTCLMENSVVAGRWTSGIWNPGMTAVLPWQPQDFSICMCYITPQYCHQEANVSSPGSKRFITRKQTFHHQEANVSSPGSKRFITRKQTFHHQEATDLTQTNSGSTKFSLGAWTCKLMC